MQPISGSGSGVTPSPAARPAWVPGQLVEALVTNGKVPGEVIVQTPRHRLTARVTNALPAERMLTLRVEHLGPPPVLSVVKVANADAPLRSAARLDLPRQASLSTLAEAVSVALRLGPQRIGAKMFELAEALAGQWPQARSAATVDGLKKALENSGLFLESRLAGAQPPTDVERDLKATLLLAQAKAGAEAAESRNVEAGARGANSATGLLDVVEAAISRVRLNQVASLPSADAAEQLWVFEIPLKDGANAKVLTLALSRDGAAGVQASARRWTLRFEFDVDPLGPVHATLTYLGEDLSLSLWAERATTSSLFADHLSVLEQDLTNAGLNLQRLDLHHGKPRASSMAVSYGPLLEEQA